ncbi:MAG TPA: hypothetical protein VMH20_04505 [Verrucomicrobiae bacterium]|nr:hypothetical protein [Verrucomicrobiae bacterium]
MARLRALGAAVLALSLTAVPLFGATTPNVAPLGTIIAADRGHVGSAIADVGTTVYAGDRLSADNPGSVQLRAGAARFLLKSGAVAEVNTTDGAPSANLISGTATFSTGNAHAFTLFASTAAIRAQSDAPTIGQVTFLNPKELVVTARRGGLTVTVADETKVVNEGESYRVLLDPSDAQEPAGAGSGSQGPMQGGGPLKAGRSHFLILVTALTAAGSGVAIYYALESPSHP